MSAPSKMTLPAVGAISRISSRPRVDFPQPDFANQAQCLARLDTQRHVVHRAQRDGVSMQQAADAHREVLGQGGGLDQRRHVSSATRMQAAVWPVSKAASGGRATAQAATA